MKKGLEKFVDLFNHVLCFFGVIFYITFVVCVLVQVISRNFLPSAPSWTEEAARYSFIYMVAFGCAVAVHRNEFVNVEFLHDALEPKFPMANKVIGLAIKLLLLGFTAYILIFSVRPFAFIKFQMLSTAMSLPMQYVYFSMVLMFGFMVIAYVCEILLTVLNWNEKEGKYGIRFVHYLCDLSVRGSSCSIQSGCGIPGLLSGGRHAHCHLFPAVFCRH